MTTIASFPTPEDAHLFRAFLESRGIEGVLLDEHFVQLFWHYSNAVGGVRVAVAEDDEREAVELYREYMESLRQGECPVAPVRGWPLVEVVSLVFGMPLLILGRKILGKSPNSPE